VAEKAAKEAAAKAARLKPARGGASARPLPLPLSNTLLLCSSLFSVHPLRQFLPWPKPAAPNSHCGEACFC